MVSIATIIFAYIKMGPNDGLGANLQVAVYVFILGLARRVSFTALYAGLLNGQGTILTILLFR